MSDFAESLGGEVGGHVRGGSWECVCGATGAEPDEHRASLALYFHRNSGHKPAAVVLEPDQEPEA